jgi:hypothetical protein
MSNRPFNSIDIKDISNWILKMHILIDFNILNDVKYLGYCCQRLSFCLLSALCIQRTWYENYIIIISYPLPLWNKSRKHICKISNINCFIRQTLDHILLFTRANGRACVDFGCTHPIDGLIWSLPIHLLTFFSKYECRVTDLITSLYHFIFGLSLTFLYYKVSNHYQM